MRITIAQYAEFRGISDRAVSWRIRYNARNGNPLHDDMPCVRAVYKLGRSYEIDFQGAWVTGDDGVGKKLISYDHKKTRSGI